MSRTAFVSISAQPENIGDILIRARCIEWLQHHHETIVVYAADMPDHYVDAFQFDKSRVTVTRDLATFLMSLARGAVRGNATYAIAPAPHIASPLIRPTMKHVGVATMVWLLRAMGARVVVVGRGLRGTGALSLAAERIIARTADLYLTRDNKTGDVMNCPVEYAPDLAFLSPLYSEGDGRNYAALSFRYDRPVDEEAMEELVVKMRALSMTPILVTQVQHDQDQHTHLAHRLGIEHLDWPDGMGALAQSERLSAILRQCAVVYSDRLHVLINGMINGAGAVFRYSRDDDKILPTLNPIIPLKHHSESDSSWLDREQLELYRKRCCLAAKSGHNTLRAALGLARDIDVTGLSAPSTSNLPPDSRSASNESQAGSPKR